MTKSDLIEIEYDLTERLYELGSEIHADRMAGLDEADCDDMHVMWEQLDALREACCVVIIGMIDAEREARYFADHDFASWS